MLRTNTCGELRKKDVGKKVKLAGWIDTIRLHGNVGFIDLRDRYGKIQIVFIKKNPDFVKLKELLVESCVQIEGEVVERQKGSENKDVETGDIEIFGDKLNIIAKSEPIPFQLDEKDLGDEVRMKYRFLDLRRQEMQNNLAFRSKVAQAVREYFIKNEFLEIETPMLVKPTPEGARDYVVPSRVNKGKFYALPQSPQLYKQILMISGFDKYFQIARCLRDEDLRQDRQPEHTQIDLEMSFADAKEIMVMVEDLYKYIFKEVLGVTLSDFQVLTYDESMKKYGTDKPDLRKNKEDPKEFAFCWIVDFPLFAKGDDGNWTPEHHMFTSPQKEFIKDMEKDPGKVKGDLFDVVLNGTELGSGSMRINDPELQERVMNIVGIDKKDAEKKFGFLLEAYKYGGPVHGGMGLGFDRLVALMLGYTDIREVIAFPRNKAAQNPMDESPSDIEDVQLKELGISVDNPKEKAKKK